MAVPAPQSIVRVIPTCVDLSRYTPTATKASRLTLVWIGSASTLQGLEIITPTLEELGARLPGLRLKIIANDFPTLANIEVLRCPWSQETEAAELASSDIGISWIPDDLWSRGKCGLKVLQYMAAGLPVVANAVGVHPEMMRDGESGLLVNHPDEFANAVVRLASDATLRQRFGAASRRIVEDRYSIEAGANAWIALLQQLQEDHATRRIVRAR